MDLRKEAEDRAQKAEKAAAVEADRRSSFRVQHQNVQQLRRLSIRTEMKVNEVDYSSQENETPKIAHLAEIDYKWNGSRAKSAGNFVLPRWVPDEEIMYCHSCNSEFDYFNRKHHCRHCGLVYCDPCSQNRVLLPHEYGYRDPMRVCNDCHEKLLPQQQYLSTNIANHQRANHIDIASTNCNVRRYLNLPYSSTLGSEIRKAAYSTHNLFSQPLHYVRDKGIPLRLLATAKGLAFITMVKGGFIFAPRLGTGLVVARLPDTTSSSSDGSEGGGGWSGWSAPTAIATAGISWGAVIGLDVTDYVIILNTDEAVAAFSGLGQLTIGAGIEVAVGPVGRSGSADFHLGDKGMAPAFSYSHSRGLYAGLSLDGSIVMARSEVNHCFYGRPVTPTELLTGKVPPPRAAAPLYDALAEAMAALPDVHHVSRPASGGGADSSRRASVGADSSRRASVGASKCTAVPVVPSSSAAENDTAQTLRDINELLDGAGYADGSSASVRVRTAGAQQQHRRRTMAALPQVQEDWGEGGGVVAEDEVWGVNSGLSAARAQQQQRQQQQQQQQYLQEEQEEEGVWLGSVAGLEDGGRANAFNSNGVTQRRARPRSLPETETRSDAVGSMQQPQVQYYQPHPYGQQQTQQQQGRGGLEGPAFAVPVFSKPAEEVLRDVPRPNSQSSGSRVGAGGSGSKLIDEELECVTANVNALL